MKKTKWVLDCWRTRNNIPCKYRKYFASREEALKAYNAFDMENPKHVMAYIFPIVTWEDFYNHTHTREGEAVYYKDNQGREHSY